MSRSVPRRPFAARPSRASASSAFAAFVAASALALGGAGVAEAGPLKATSFVRGKLAPNGLYPGPTRVLAGDFDADGKDDVLYGNGTEATLVYGTEPSSDLDLSAALGTKGVRFQTVPRADFETNDVKDVDPAGDFDGDGVDDVLISTDLAVFVVYGARGASTGTIVLEPGVRITTVTTKAGIADDVAGIGDFNGDGRDDIAVQRSSAGAAIVLGGPRTPTIDTSNSGPRTSLVNSSVRCALIFFNYQCVQMGVDFEPLGDFDGDGKADLAVENQERNGNFVLYGRTGSFTVGAASPTTATRLPASTTEFSQTIGDITRAGDVNGDGYADLVSWGSVLILGRPGRPKGISAAEPNIKLGPAPNSDYTVEAIGDQNADGRDDLAVHGVAGAGQVRIVTAIPASAPGVIDPTAGALIAGLPATVDSSLEGGGDIDGDGLGDLVIGAPGDGESAYLVTHGTGTPSGSTRRPATLTMSLLLYDGRGAFIDNATVTTRAVCDGVAGPAASGYGSPGPQLGQFEESNVCTVTPTIAFPNPTLYASCRWREKVQFNYTTPTDTSGPVTLDAGANILFLERRCELPTTDYPVALNVPGWTYSGSAVQNDYLLDLNGPSANQTGSAMWGSPLDYRNKTLEFEIRFAGGNGQAEGATLAFVTPGGDGQPGGGRLGGGGPLLGFGGLSGVALAFDQKKDAGDPTANFLGLTDGVAGGNLRWLTTADPGVRLRDPGTRKIKVVNKNGTTTVFVAGKQRLKASFPIPPSAFLAFTSATSSTYQLHSVAFLKITGS